MKHAEATLLQHLADPDSLDFLAREGLITEANRVIIPSFEVRILVAWALEAFFVSGRTHAPSFEALRSTWADHLEQYGITIDTETEPDSVQWAVEDLRANYARLMAEKLMADFAKEMGQVDGPEKLAVFGKYVDLMFVTHQALVSRRKELPGDRGVEDALHRLADRMENGHATKGLLFGIPEIDKHTFGVHPGEICTIAAPPGLGKSWAAGMFTIANWRLGVRVLLVTLENDLEMTYDRLCCIAAEIEYEQWQLGTVTTSQKECVELLRQEMADSECKPIVVQLDEMQRTASGIVRKAMLEDAQGVIIDQLSFVDAESSSKALKRHERVVEIMQRLKVLINEGVYRVPTILFSQMTREGIAASRKSGRFHQEDMADSRSVEQFSDTVWAIYQGEDMRPIHEVQFQQLKSRRTIKRHFQLTWRPERGFVKFNQEVTL